jgi:predicted ATPase
LAVLFTDVVGSTRLWAEHHDAMADDLALHDDLLRDAIAHHGGHVFATAGDSFAAAFPTPRDAVDAAVDAQLAMTKTTWTVPDGLHIRVAIHAGEVIERGGDYFGPTLNTAARVLNAAHGGQVLVTAAAASDLSHPTMDLGEHRLRDIDAPVRIHQLRASGLEQSFPPLVSLASGRSRLPQHRSSFVGRGDDMRRLRQMLHDSRLVTVTGVGGVGKTRIAVEVAAAEQAAFADGVFFVDLAPVTDPDAVPVAVVTGIDLTVDASGELRSEIVRFLSTRSVLLVIDNCEHLLDEVAELVDDLLTQAPRLRVLATSREALELEGEETLRLGSLDPTEEGLRLFVDRATAVDRDFDLNDSTRESAIELCRHLDGIPLAVELAASRTRTFSPTELLTKLDDRFAVLRGGRRRGSMQRQRTLEAAIDWSYELLDEAEKRFFRALGVFAGTFVLEVVPTVADVSPSEALDLLDSLVSKSLVVPTRIDDEQSGYQLLETVQAFARARLAEAGDTEAAAERHERAYFAYCESRTREQRMEWSFCHAYKSQINDLWAAADRALDHGRPEVCVRILGTGHPAVEGSAYGAEELTRLTNLWQEWAEELPVGLRTVVAGLLADASMTAMRFGDAGRLVRDARRIAEQATAQERVLLDYVELLMLTASDPSGVHEACDELIARLAESGAEQEQIDEVQGFRSAAFAANRDYESASRIALGRFRARRALPFDRVGAYVLWLAHLLGRSPRDDVVEFARSLTREDTPYAITNHVAAAMCGQMPPDKTGAVLVSIGERMLTGRLPGEEAELLVAFARLRQLAGDTDRALALTEVTAPRAPWTFMVFNEVVGGIEGWPTDEWRARSVETVLARAEPDRLAAIREQAPIVLADEMARW